MLLDFSLVTFPPFSAQFLLVWAYRFRMRSSRSRICQLPLLSLVVLGTATDDVLPCHSNEIYNLIVVVIGQQRLGRNEPQVDLLDLRLGFLLEGRRGTAVDAATAATATGHGLVVETSMNIATAAAAVVAAGAVGAPHGRGIATGSGCVVHYNRWRSS